MTDTPKPKLQPETPLPHPTPPPAGVDDEDMRYAEELEREQDA